MYIFICRSCSRNNFVCFNEKISGDHTAWDSQLRGANKNKRVGKKLSESVIKFTQFSTEGNRKSGFIMKRISLVQNIHPWEYFD